MGDFKFSCPACGQHLRAEDNYQGRQINCPACQAAFTVPIQAPSPITHQVSEPGAVQTPSTTQPTKEGRNIPALAKASLVLSIASLGIGPLGFIPGIICGHLARRRIERDDRLGGKSLANAGLLVGYGFVGLTIVTMMVVWPVIFKAVDGLQQATKSSVSSASGTLASIDQGSGIAEIAWTNDVKAVEIPSAPARGRVHGRPFVCQTAEFGPKKTPQILTLQQGNGPEADIKFTILIGQPDGFEGKTINLGTASDTPEVPADQDSRVAILWLENGQYHPRQFSRKLNGFVLRLECQPRAHGRIKGRIYLCLSDAEKSYVAGSFDAKLR
jgi:hypothetical protein